MRPHLVVVSRQLPAQQLGLAGQPAYCLLETLQRLQLAAQPAILPVQPTGLPVQPTGLPVQPTGLPVQPTGLPVQPTGLPVQPTGLPVQPTGLRSATVSRFSRRVSRFSRRVSRFSRRVSRFSRRVSRFSRRVSRFREPTSPRSALIVSFCFRVRSSALRSRALARGGEACAARFDLRSAATFLRNATSSSFCSCERSSALRSRAFSLDSGPVVSFLAAGAGAALSGRGPPPGGARSHSSGPAMPARLRATGRLPCAAT